MSKFHHYLTALLTPLAISCVRDLPTADQFYTPDAIAKQSDSTIARPNDSLTDILYDSPKREPQEELFSETRTPLADTPSPLDLVEIYDISQDSTSTSDTSPDLSLIDTIPDIQPEIPFDTFLNETVPDATIDIPPKNNPPQLITLENKIIQEAQSLAFTITATDAENDPITYILQSEPPQNFTFNAKTGKVSFTPNYTFVKHPNVIKETSFTFGAFDGKEYAKPITLKVTVQDINHLPKISSTPLLEALVGEIYTYTINATDEDVEDTLSYTILSPTNASLDKNIFTWKPTKDQLGKQDLEIKVTDGIDDVKQKGTISVEELTCYTSAFKTGLDKVVGKKGTWEWNQQGYVQQTEKGGGLKVAIIDTKDYDNFEASVKFRMINSLFGVEQFTLFPFRYDPITNKGYAIAVGQANQNSFLIQLLDIGGKNIKQVGMTCAPNIGTTDCGVMYDVAWYSVKVKAIGNNIKAYFEGKEVFTLQDNTYTSGKIGFATLNVRADFDDVNICPL